ncbi:VanZ family protein [Paenibacillus sp. 1P07SE]|uniref:VanZ family protein n=1 Tax=Paenibacillus sp. 1P07SE TaxID=3132209 RepID=UPI0039A50D1B
MTYRTVFLQILLIIYFSLLIKVILFKGHAIDVSFLVHQFQISWQEPLRVVERIQRGNLIPFHEITRALDAGTRHGNINLVGNIGIFMPFGLLLGLLGSDRRFIVPEVLGKSLMLSLFLEMSQAIFAMGTFDVDDIILNTVGGLCGVLAYVLWGKASGMASAPRETDIMPVRTKRV